MKGRGVGRCFVFVMGGTSNTWLPWQRCLPYEACKLHNFISKSCHKLGGGGGGHSYTYEGGGRQSGHVYHAIFSI